MKLKNITSEIKQVKQGSAIYFNGSLQGVRYILQNVLKYNESFRIGHKANNIRWIKNER